MLHRGVEKVSHLPALQFSHKGKLQLSWKHQCCPVATETGKWGCWICSCLYYIIGCSWPLAAFQEGFNTSILLSLGGVGALGATLRLFWSFVHLLFKLVDRHAEWVALFQAENDLHLLLASVGIKMLIALLFWKQDWGILEESHLDDLLCKVDGQRIIGWFCFGFAFNLVFGCLLACDLWMCIRLHVLNSYQIFWLSASEL